MGKKYDISDAQLDEILSQVGDMAEELAKSEKAGKKLKKDESEEDEHAPKEDAPKDDAPEAEEEGSDEPAPPPAEGDGAAPAPEAAAPEEGAADPMEGGAEGEGGSDEELQQIYGSMPPEELERHYMIIRQLLQGHYAGSDAGAEGGAPAPAPAEPPMGKGEMEGAANGGNAGGGVKPDSMPKFQSDPKVQKEEASAASIGAKPDSTHKFQSDPKVQKSEQDPEKLALKAKLEALETQVGSLVTALEKSFKPQRKAIQGIEYISKSEIEEVKPESAPQGTKRERLAHLVKSEGSKLTSDDRQAINRFFLYGEDDPKLDKLISGGK